MRARVARLLTGLAALVLTACADGPATDSAAGDAQGATVAPPASVLDRVLPDGFDRVRAEVTAADIALTSDIEILNTDLVLATLNKQGRLAVDLTVDKGRGYRSADANKSSATIGVIPVDSIFSPVRRVSFEVEPTRVEQSTEYDRLVLDIETDGSITPRDALASAGDTLRSLVGLVAEMSDEPQGLELGELAVTTAGSPDLDLPIEDLDLSERPRNCLKRAQVNTVGELVQKTEDDLLAITNFGQKSLDEVIVKLDERGLSLRNKD